MSTIKDLIDKHGLPVKVREKQWPCKDDHMKIIAVNEKAAIGFYDDGNPAYKMLGNDGNNWELYLLPLAEVDESGDAPGGEGK